MELRVHKGTRRLSQYIDALLKAEISILKIRRSHDCRIYNENHYTREDDLYIETGPCDSINVF